MDDNPDEQTHRGKILRADDHGTVWQLWYESEARTEVVLFEHRPFAHFYEGATGRSFVRDYNFGAGREYVSNQLKGRCISVESQPYETTVLIEDEEE